MPSRLTRIVATGVIIATLMTTPLVALADNGGNDGGGDGAPVIVVGGGKSGASGGGEIDTGIGISGKDQSLAPTAANGSSSDHTASSNKRTDNANSGPSPTSAFDREQNCIDLRVITPSPPASDPRWQGANPATHDLYSAYCIEAFVLGTADPVRAWAYLVADKGKSPAQPPPPPNPAQLASDAWVHMRTLIPAPSATTSPDLPHNIDAATGHAVTYVNLWMWYWTTDDIWKPITQTLSERGVSVTVTATPETLAFDPGNGEKQTKCANPPGRPWTQADGDYPPSNTAGCGYRYTHLIPADQPNSVTSGAPKGTITATLTIGWKVEWASNTGVAGILPTIETVTHTVPFTIEQIPIEVK